MIRLLEESDIPSIVEMVQQDRHISASDIEDRVKNCDTWVWDSGSSLLGCVAVGKVSQGPDEPVVRAWVYTAPDYRRQGIGTRLWEQASSHIASLHAAKVYTTYRADMDHSRQLFVKQGFQPWFSIHTMQYEGDGFGQSTLQPVPYSDEMFDDFVRLTNDGFRELRRQCNIDPADCYPTGFNVEEARKTAHEDKNNIFFIYEEGKAIGYTQLCQNYIDTITIDEAYRGRGLGRKITELSVNLLRERGADTVFLGVMDVNKLARRLYESMGFEFVETTEYARASSVDLCSKVGTI